MPQTYVNAVGRVLSSTGFPTHSVLATTAGQRLVGTSGDDEMRTVPGGTTLVGGLGDDTYFVYSATDKVIEQPGEGNDTVVSYAPYYTLPANVENLTVGFSGSGNAGDNILTASGPGPHTLAGGGGNDVFVASEGQDRFVVANDGGSDVIVGFTPGTDKVELDGFSRLSSFSAVQAALRQVGADAVLDLGAGASLTFRGLDASKLGAGDFALPFSTAGLRMTFDDEFNSLSASPDGTSTTWRSRYDYGRYNPVSGEAEYNSDSSVGTNPFSLANGVVTITASPATVSGANPAGAPYNSGVLTTEKSFGQQYGYFEIRAELPSGQGFWPAFWLLPTDHSWPPEIDVFEVLGQDPSTLYASTHVGTALNQTAVTTPVHVADTSAGFHTYGLSWDANKITWYFDGNQIKSTDTPAELNKPMYILFNLAVGKDGSWPGAADGVTSGQMKVDYVRAYATASTVNVSGPSALTTAAAPATASTPQSGTTGSTAGGSGSAGTTSQAASTSQATTSTTATATATDSTPSGSTTTTASQAAATTSNPTAAAAGTVSSGASSTAAATTGSAGTTSQATSQAAAVGAASSTTTPSTTTATGGAGTTTQAASQTAAATLTLTDWGKSVVRGDGSFSVTGAGSGGHVVLGNGNQAVALTGWNNAVLLGDGNHAITLAGNSNTVTVGSGVSRIDAGANFNTIAVGASRTGTTVVKASGYANTIFSTGSGAVAVSGTTGAATVSLKDGNHVVTLGGSGNVVTTGGGNSTIQAGIGQAVVHAGNGNDTITVSGWNNLLDGGGGQNVLIGGNGNDTFVLNAPDAGFDRIGNFRVQNHDVLDLSRTLAGTAVAKDLSNLRQFISTTAGTEGTTLLVDTTGGHASPRAFALLQGVGTSVGELIANHDLQVNGRLA